MLVESGVVAVGEGANMPCDPAALAIFKAAGVVFCPGKAANAGGVATRCVIITLRVAKIVVVVVVVVDVSCRICLRCCKHCPKPMSLFARLLDSSS